ncbi:hypothetical protein B0H10DRAFT_1970804 [Mycena sp. CBHHK59/15]|nr:hypothetical protein B0H10DRAFT_1970804 [Mycena sp. CBHHK59/15]
MHQNPNIIRSAAGPSTLHSPPLSDNDEEPCTPPPLPSPPPQLPPNSQKTFHPFLNGRLCNEAGEYLPEGTPPPPHTTAAADDWSPYEDSVQFNVVDFLFRKVQISSRCGHCLMKHKDLGPFENYQHLYETIDATKLGDAPWQCFQTEPLAVEEDAPAWACQSYEIWYRDPEVVIANMLENPDFDGAFDTAPYVELDSEGKQCMAYFPQAFYAMGMKR